jgi:protein-ribulosamine 3-kinase
VSDMLPQAVGEWCASAGFGEILTLRPVGGGCINNGAVLKTVSGESFFLKTNQDAAADMFAREAEGLKALCVSGGPRLPFPYLFDTQFILLEDLAPTERSKDYWPIFGRQLAALHNHTEQRFGFVHDNYIGSTPQPNPWTVDGYTFFSEYRLLHQAQMARRRGLVDLGIYQRVEHLCTRLTELVPEQPASLIHGDLWSGNAMTGSGGEPAIIDPAAYYGWAEADLAMTDLFGVFPSEFYDAYLEVRPLHSGFRDRFPLYNLYHLLNHLNLFGGSYFGQVLSVLYKFN